MDTTKSNAASGSATAQSSTAQSSITTPEPRTELDSKDKNTDAMSRVGGGSTKPPPTLKLADVAGRIINTKKYGKIISQKAKHFTFHGFKVNKKYQVEVDEAFIETGQSRDRNEAIRQGGQAILDAGHDMHDVSKWTGLLLQFLDMDFACVQKGSEGLINVFLLSPNMKAYIQHFPQAENEQARLDIVRRFLEEKHPTSNHNEAATGNGSPVQSELLAETGKNRHVKGNNGTSSAVLIHNESPVSPKSGTNPPISNDDPSYVRSIQEEIYKDGFEDRASMSTVDEQDVEPLHVRMDHNVYPSPLRRVSNWVQAAYRWIADKIWSSYTTH